jgi:peptidoglycan/LPS O-acetylase OafA/YrhL
LSPKRDLSLTSDWANLDLLRTWAVLSVLVDHLFMALRIGPLLTIGYDLGRLGVPLFFVHTSLVLMLSLERSEQRSSSSPSREFYIRRAFRIYPLSVVTVLVVVMLRVPIEHGVSLIVPTARTVLSNLALVQNLTAAPSVTGPLWSLPLEVQMYLVLPLLYRFARRYATAQVVLLGASLAMLSLGYQYAAPRVRGLGRLDIVSFVPCFLAGILAYSLSRRRRVRFPSWMWPLFLAVIVSLYLVWQAVSPALPIRHVPYRGWVVCWLIGAFVTQFGELTSPWLRSACHLVAKYSYGIYLGQVIAIWIGFDLCSRMPVGLRFLISMLGLAGMTLVAYHAIESPGMSVGKRLARRFCRVPPIRSQAA